MHELRERADELLDRVAAGETITITGRCDAMIAAVAIANGLPLYTCNPADFAGIDGLEVVPIPHPDTP